MTIGSGHSPDDHRSMIRLQDHPLRFLGRPATRRLRVALSYLTISTLTDERHLRSSMTSLSSTISRK